ncbi:hypothetical protein AB0L65_55470 [Nonomuraea sp. NPDC052116]|uniref:hypothetical protein n=1 Tax=Nonomuraea sp. NPDC052116 TaxID=3155665 RepID=UPI003430229B
MASITRNDAATPARRRPDRRPAANGMSRRTRLRRDRTLLVMTVPALVLLIVFTYAPMIGSVMAFQFYDVSCRTT